jgi:hypothetical protein
VDIYRAAVFILSVLIAMIGANHAQSSRVPAQQLRDAMRLARDGDLQADWGKMLAARERLVALTRDADIAARAHYFVGYTDWRLSALAYVGVGPQAQQRLTERAIESLQKAVARDPSLLEAQALLATCGSILVGLERARMETMLPVVTNAWKASAAGVGHNPRVTLLRAMNQTFAPAPYGNRDEGHRLWQQAIDMFEQEGTDPSVWGRAEAFAWRGGAHLIANEPAQAVPWLERATALRPDFWWAAKVALPMARRPQ